MAAVNCTEKMRQWYSLEDEREGETMPKKRARRTFSEEQKQQLVELFNHGKPRSEIIREYDLTASAFDKWVKRINATGSSGEKDNRTIEEQELIKLRKENQ